MAILTDAQLATFKSDIESNTDTVVVAALAAGANNAIADWYSLVASPDYWVFKNVVPISEVSSVIELDDVANMTSGDNEKLKTFYAIRSESGVFASKQTDRDGFNDIFSSAAGDDSQQALVALWKRLANNLEELFATGAGTNANPSTMATDGNATLQNVRDALAS